MIAVLVISIYKKGMVTYFVGREWDTTCTTALYVIDKDIYD